MQAVAAIADWQGVAMPIKAEMAAADVVCIDPPLTLPAARLTLPACVGKEYPNATRAFHLAGS